MKVINSPMELLEGSSPWAGAIGFLAILVVLIRWVVSSGCSEKKGKNTSNVRELAPWYFPGPLGIVPLLLMGDGGFPAYVRKRRKELGNSYHVFTFSFLDWMIPAAYEGRHMILTNIDDINKVYSQHRKLDLVVGVPEAATLMHGKGNIQNLKGARHAFQRKIFSSLLYPKALQGFLPYILSAFEDLWNDVAATNTNETIVLRDSIQRAQFFLMAEILYGIKGLTPESPERALAEHLQENFRKEDEALFASKNSKTFQEGYEASKENKAILWDRFQSILEATRTATSGSGKDTIQNSVVGNSFQAIAQALVETGKDTDPETLAELRDTLLLLLEASHGTTMYVTTSMMYFLHHPDNKQCLQKLREEANSFEGVPEVANLKHDMPYVEACIHETMRLAPVVGSVHVIMPSSKSVTLPGSGVTLEGPVQMHLQSSNWYRDPDLFPQPDKFLPQRWLEDAPAQIKVSDKAKKPFLPFGGGAHVCLGQSLARLVLKASMFCFARNPKICGFTFDPREVKPVPSVFPEVIIKDGFPCKVVVAKSGAES